MNRHLMETQNLVISFDYSWFLAKNLAYAECRIMKFHYRNLTTTQAVKIKFELDKKSSLFQNRFFFEFEIEKKSSDTQYFKNQVEIDRGNVA